MFVCKFCGKALEDGSKFCNSCGAMVTDPAKFSEDVPTMPLESYDENVTLDSLIENIDTFSMCEDGDVATVPFTEDGDMVTMPLEHSLPEKNADVVTVPLVEENDDVVTIPLNYRVSEENDTLKSIKNNKSEDNVTRSKTEYDEIFNNKEKIRKILVIAIIVTVAVLFFIFLIAIEANLILPNISQEDSSFQEYSPVETAREEIEYALRLDSIDAVREVYNRYVPEYYDDSEPLSEEAQVVVDELVEFYDDVYREIEKRDFPAYEDPDDFLREEWGDIVVDSYGGVQTIWEHGDAYAPDELVSSRKAVEDLCYQIEWR